MKRVLSIKNFMIGSKNIERDSYLWNMIGTTIMAFQSVILLMILTRVVDLEASGVFTIAYTTANLLLTVGKYGVHNYQVSDTEPLFNFGDYRVSRWITTIAMLVAAAGYSAFSLWSSDHSGEKIWIIFWMCVFKAVDAVEDVWCSLYQQRGRLDVSGKLMTVRVVLTLIFFSVCLFVLRSLLPSLVATTVFTTVLLFLLNIPCRSVCAEQTREKAKWRRVRNLFALCFPLFLMGFLSYYVTNAPKYSIDSLLSDEYQACYGFIAMPVFVVGLMGNYLFNPVIRPLSERWQQGDLAWFRKQLIKQGAMVMAITVVCVGGAYLLGTPVLSLMYGTDLTAYRTELLILVAGGGFLALSNQLMTVITIIRRQKLLLIGYGVCTVLALVLSPIMVKHFRIMGAAVLELGLMLLLCLIFGVILMIEMQRAANRQKKGGMQ